jgi:acyl-CoA thioesterase
MPQDRPPPPGGIADRLGIAVSKVGGGRAIARRRVTADHLNGHGVAHGGVVFLLADTAFDHACNSHGPVTLARAADITFVEAVKAGDELVAVAEEQVRRGRSGVYDVTVSRADGTMVALFRGHSQTLAGERPG